MIDAVADRNRAKCIAFAGRSLIERRLENASGTKVFRIKHGRASGTRPSWGNGKNLVLIVEVTLHQGSDLPKVAQVFCGFRTLKSTPEGWNEDRGEYADRHDYYEQFDEGESVPNVGRGSFCHGFWG